MRHFQAVYLIYLYHVVHLPTNEKLYSYLISDRGVWAVVVRRFFFLNSPSVNEAIFRRKSIASSVWLTLTCAHGIACDHSDHGVLVPWT